MTELLHLGGAGAPLHLAHANAYTPGAYRQLATELAADFQVWALPLRPLWPGSDPAGLPRWRDLADDLIAALDAAGLQGVIGVGHSLGAVVTMYAALARPALFSRLVLIEPVFLAPQILAMAALPAAAEVTAKLPLVRTALRRRAHWPDRQATFDHWRGKRVFARLSDAALWDVVAHGVVAAPDGDGVILRYSPQWEARIYATPPLDVWEVLPRVTRPTLALRAADSDTLQPAQWALWQEKQPAATFVEVPETGHLLPFEAPRRLGGIILDWLGAA